VSGVRLRIESGDGERKHIIGPNTTVWLDDVDISRHVHAVDFGKLEVGRPATASLHVYLDRLEVDLPEVAVKVIDLTPEPERTAFGQKFRQWLGWSK
jgi:hypothetical protein